MDVKLRDQFERVVRADGRYPPAAFEFLQAGLELATRSKHGNPGRGRARHVTGQELAQALRVLAVRRWGLLAHDVLKHWNIRRTRDFGEMVNLMIDVGLMGKQDSDDIADFDDVYDFAEAFGAYRIAPAAAAGVGDPETDAQETAD